MRQLGAYCIDRYETHLVERTGGGLESMHSPYQRPEKGVHYVARSHANTVPQGYINRFEAEAACENARKRLCTLSEWYLACAGANRQTYPYGPREKKGYCNTAKPHLLAKFHGKNARRWDYDLIQRIIVAAIFVGASIVIWADLNFDILVQLAGFFAANMAIVVVAVAAFYLNHKLPPAYRTRTWILVGAIASTVILSVVTTMSGYGLLRKLFL